MKIAILGFGIEGQAAYSYWHALDPCNEITICDQNANLQLPEGASGQLGADYLAHLDQFDLLVRSPQIHPRYLAGLAPEKVTSNTNEFFKVCPTKHIIGVTGTKGKGTTSTLITKLLEASGKTVHLGGNIGVAPLEILKQNIQTDDFVVLELSNFQLIDLTCSPPLAVCLMVVPEHLDWHTDNAEYVAAKQQLFRWQQPEDTTIYFADNHTSKQITSISNGHKIPYFTPPGAFIDGNSVTIDGHAICQTHELKLLGAHNWQNVCAAVTAIWQIDQNVDAIRSVLTSFSGLEHRIEFLRTVNDIHYYNDSFATGLHASEAAIEAVPGKKVVVLGGYDRMLPLEHFGSFAVKTADQYRTLLLIGASAKRLAEVLDKAGFTNYVIDETAKTMDQVVAKATSLAKSDDAVLLSPGFASFDMFKNFEDRGNQFKSVVATL